MKVIIRLLIVLYLSTFAAASWSVEILQCEDSQGNKSFATICPPGTKQINKKNYSTGTPDSGNSSPSLSATLYVVPNCDSCDQVKEFLEVRNIPVTEKNVSGNADLQKELKDKTGGTLRVPVLVIGDKVVKGYNRTTLLATLAAAGYKETPATTGTETAGSETTGTETTGTKSTQ